MVSVFSLAATILAAATTTAELNGVLVVVVAASSASTQRRPAPHLRRPTPHLRRPTWRPTPHRWWPVHASPAHHTATRHLRLVLGRGDTPAHAALLALAQHFLPVLVPGFWVKVVVEVVRQLRLFVVPLLLRGLYVVDVELEDVTVSKVCELLVLVG